MATKKIPDVEPWNRNYWSEVEAIAMLNATRPQWELFREQFTMKVKPNAAGQYRREVLETWWERFQ